MASSAWKIKVGVEVDTSDIQHQLDNGSYNLGGSTRGIKNLTAAGNQMNLTYQAAHAIFTKSIGAISNMVGQVKEMDKAITEFRKISELSGSSLDSYIEELSDAGKATGRTASAMLEAATMFRKSGFNDQEAKNLATMATMYQNISDVQVSASDAAATIVSQLQAYGRENLEPIHILDAYNKVAADFAIGTNDISKAMEVAAAGMATYGNSFEETIGLITAGTEIMQGRSSQVARGLNTIAAHVVSSKDKLLEYGIQVEDTNGNLKSTYEVLKELKPIWDTLSDSQKVALGKELAGGVNQYKVLASIMQNFDHAVGATTSALNSNGVALSQNAAYMESIEAKTTAVSAAFQQMSLKIVSSDMVKGILDIVKALAEFGSTDIGSIITQIILLSGVQWGGLMLLGNSIIPGIIGGFKVFISVLKGATLQATAAALGFKTTLAAGLAGTLPIILGVTAAIVTLVTIIRAISNAYEKANPSVAEAYNKMQQTKTSLENMSQAYENAKIKLQELNSVKYEDRTVAIQNEIADLEALIKYYEAIHQIMQGTYGLTRDQYIKSVEKKGLEVPDKGIKVTYKPRSAWSQKDVGYTEEYDSLGEAVTSAAARYFELTGNVLEFNTVMEGQMKLLQVGGISFSNITVPISEVQQDFKNLNSEMQQNQEITPRIASEYERLMKMATPYADALKEKRLEGIHALTAEEEEFLRWYGTVKTAYEGYEQSSSQATNALTSNITQAIDTLSSFAQNLLAAASAYDEFKNRLSQTGDYDDSFKGLTSVFGELNGEIEKGQVGSKAFFTALELLTGQTFPDSASATEYLNNNLETLSILFGDSESGGIGLITAMQKLQSENKLTGASVKTVGDDLEITVDNFSDLAKSLGISEGSLYSLTQALKVLGINFEYNSQDILDNIKQIDSGLVTLDQTTGKQIVNFEEFAKQAYESGKMTIPEIMQIGDVLQNTSNVELSGLQEGLTYLASNAEDTSSNANDATNSLNNLGNTTSNVQNVASAAGTLSSNLSSAAESATTLAEALGNLKFPSLFHFAEGTNFAEEGDSLVNEEGPELIQSRDRAYIAGGGAPTITHLHRGDKVYTAEETKDILKNRELKGVIQSHKGGSSGKSTVGIKSTTTTKIPKSLMASLQNKLNQYTNSQTGDGKKDSSSSSSSKSVKEEFDEWLKAKKHALAMDEITEKEYYTELEKMNEKYFKNSKEYQDEYWKYQEEVYKWRKSQLDDENELLEKQIDLEKALSELAKAKEQKILVYKDGRFQYVQDIDAIDEAQRNVSKLKADLGYASGTSSASAGIHLVGENGPELRVLNSGDGIIPADTTKNLLNLAQMSVSKLSGDLNKAMQVLYSFNIDNLSLPNVANASEFFEGLKNYAYQYSYAQ